MASDIDLQNISKKGVLPSASCYFILPVQSILIPPYISIQGSIKRRKRRFFKDAVGFPEKNRVSVTTKVLPKYSLHLAVVSFLSPTLCTSQIEKVRISQRQYSQTFDARKSTHLSPLSLDLLIQLWSRPLGLRLALGFVPVFDHLLSSCSHMARKVHPR